MTGQCRHAWFWLLRRNIFLFNLSRRLWDVRSYLGQGACRLAEALRGVVRSGVVLSPTGESDGLRVLSDAPGFRFSPALQSCLSCTLWHALSLPARPHLKKARKETVRAFWSWPRERLVCAGEVKGGGRGRERPEKKAEARQRAQSTFEAASNPRGRVGGGPRPGWRGSLES